MRINIINATPHDITDCETGIVYKKPADPKNIARVKQITTNEGRFDNGSSVVGTSLHQRKFSDKVEGLPEKINDNDFFIVSSMVAEKLKGTSKAKHLLMVGESVRTPEGVIKGCIGFNVVEEETIKMLLDRRNEKTLDRELTKDIRTL